MQADYTKEELFEKIYWENKDDIYRISLYYVKDTYIAEDVTQKTFFNFYLHSKNVREERVRPYLIRTARNLSYNWIRDTKKETDGEYLDNVPEEDLPLFSAEDIYFRDEKKRRASQLTHRILDALREENESWYDILHLIYGLDKSFDDVAQELGVTKEVVYSKYYRAKRWIRKRFEKEYEEL